MGQGDVPTSRGGPLRRRKEKRQLEHLASSSPPDGAARTSAAHVKVIGDQPPTEADEVEVEKSEPDTPTTCEPQARPSGFHVRAVPIDQPIGD